jgi:hypothetical protein
MTSADVDVATHNDRQRNIELWEVASGRNPERTSILLQPELERKEYCAEVGCGRRKAASKLGSGMVLEVMEFIIDRRQIARRIKRASLQRHRAHRNNIAKFDFRKPKSSSMSSGVSAVSMF